MEASMSEQPSAELLSQLDRLGLATAEQVASMRPRVRSLAGKLPWFDSLWVDALRMAKLVTPYQATELCSGRGGDLQAGPFVIQRPLGQCHFATVYEAREIATREQVRLLLAPLGNTDGRGDDASGILKQVRGLIETSKHVEIDALSPPTDIGIDEKNKPYRVWVSSAPVAGTSAGEWMVSSGRFPPLAALEIATQMAAALAELERLEWVHADLSVAGLLIDDEGNVRLPHAGLRAVLRPAEGYGFADLVPQAYDALAPERVADGTAPSIASDIYSCGCVWWQLLTGRSPLGGGDSLARLQAAHRAKILDVRRLAPETPPQLAAAIDQCLQFDAARRPASFADLAKQLGESTAEGRRLLADCITQTSRPSIFQELGFRESGPIQNSRTGTKTTGTKTWAAATIAGAIAVGAIAWPLWQKHIDVPAASLSAAAVSADEETQSTDVVLGQAGELGRAGTAANQFADDEDLAQRQGVSRAEDEIAQAAATREDVLLLSADRPLSASDLKLRAGQIVRGLNGARPRIVISQTPLVIDVDDVRFENVDFVATHTDISRAKLRSQALVDARCRRVEFRGCSFQGDLGGSPVAIDWKGSAQAADSLGPSEQVLLMSDCLLRGVAAGVVMETPQGRTVELDNSLALGPGPLLRIEQCPPLDEPLAVNLANVTVRGAAALVEFRYDVVHDEPGMVSIHATNSVFSPIAGGTLFFCNGLPSPARILRRIHWTGEGSLLAESAIVASWQSDTATPMTVDDSQLAIDGLSRSRFTFAASDLGDAASSQVVEWSAPLATQTPPGIRSRMVLDRRVD